MRNGSTRTSTHPDSMTRRSTSLALAFLLILSTLSALIFALPMTTAVAQDVVGSIAMGGSPYGAGVNPTTNKIYVADHTGGSVSVIDGSTDTVTTTVTVGSYPCGVDVNSTTNMVYVVNFYGNSVSVIDGATDTVTATVAVGTNPWSVGVNPATNKIYVTNYAGNSVSVIDGATDTVTTTVAVGTNPCGIDANPTTNVVYVANSNSDSVSVIDGATDTVTATVAVGSNPYNVGINPATNVAYTANYSGNSVSVIDGATDTVTATVAVGSNPWSVDANPVINVAYTANYGGNSVSVIDGATDTVTATVAVGSNPRDVGVDPSTSKVYIPNSGSGSVSVILDAPAPTVTSIDPASGSNDGTVSVTDLAGTGFLDGATVTLKKLSQADIAAGNVVVVNDTRITCDLDLDGVASGSWDVVVANLDTHEGVLAGGFTVNHVPFSDEFSGSTLDPRWSWTDPLGDCTNSLTANPGYLRISVPDGGHDLWPGVNYAAPRVTQPVAGDFIIETRVLFDPQYHAQQAGILVWSDNDNFLLLNRRCSNEGQTVIYGVDAGGTISSVYAAYSDTTTCLRMVRQGDVFSFYYGSNGINWSLLGSTTLAVTDPVEVGLLVMDQWQDNPIYADFDYFRFQQSAPTVTSIDPAIGINEGVVSVTDLAGTGFLDGAEVSLKKLGQADIAATDVVVVSDTQITCDLDLTGAATGTWDVVVTNPDTQEGTLPFGFRVQLSSGSLAAWGYNGYGQCDVPTGNDFIAVAGGDNYGLGLRSGGSLAAWGGRGNDYGQCTVPAGNDFTAITAGYYHGLALRSDGSLIAWGFNDWNQCDVPAENDFVTVAAGGNHSLALRSDGSLAAWGVGWYGLNTVPAGNDYVAIAAGAEHNLALRSDGSLAAWGSNEYGQCAVSTDKDFVAVSGGRGHSLALRSDGTLAAWGLNDYSQCVVPAENDFVAISAGGSHNLALRSDGSLAAWGRNNYGQCDVPAGNDFVAVAGGSLHSLAIAQHPAPTITSIDPPSGSNDGTVSVTDLAGTGFYGVPTVVLKKLGQADIAATNVVVMSSMQITCDLDLDGVAAGTWDVVVTNPDTQEGVLAGGFTVNHVPFSDEFSGSTLDPRWTWLDPGSDCSWSLTDNPGYLRISVPNGNNDISPYNEDAPRITQQAGGDFTIETKVLFDPSYGSQGAGLLVFKDYDNYLRLERGRWSGPDVLMYGEVGGATTSSEVSFSGNPSYLRIVRQSDVFSTFCSDDGVNWSPVGSATLAVADPVSVGLDTCQYNYSSPISADFDYFRCNRHFVNASVSGGHGTVNPTSQVVARGGSATVNIYPDTHYHVASVTDNGSTVTPTPSGSYTINPVTNNHNVVVTYAIDTYTLSTGQVGSGSVAKNPGQSSYDYGTSVELTATPGVGYHFVEWTGDLTGTTSPASLTMDANKTAIAHFAVNTYTLTTGVTGSGSVAKDPSQSTYDHGTSVELTASPAVGYHFVEWTGDLTGTTNPDNLIMNGNKTVTAVFAINTYTVSTGQVGSGSVAKNPSQSSYDYGTSVELTATPGVGYHFVEWTGDLTGTTSPASLTMDANKTAIAHFAVNTHTLTVNTTGSGSVAKDPDQPTYDYGTSVQLTASPAVGYHFVEWTGDLTGTTNPASLTMNGNKTVTAVFAINTYTVNASVTGGHGTVTEATQNINHGASATIHITPEMGYHIDSITDNGATKTIANPYVINNVTAAHTVVVTFAQDRSPDSTRYLPEGSTNWGFDCYVSIENPNTEAVNVKLTYMTSAGPVTGPTVAMPAKSQATVYPSSTLGAADFSTKVECLEGRTISVDRTMYWTGPGAACPEAHCATGVTSPATTWYMPEGSSNWGFECFLLIANPNDTAANCTVTWMIEGKAPVTSNQTVGANSRSTLNMADFIGAADASIKVTSNIPVIPERAMYRNDRREGHDSTGTAQAAADYYLAEGCAGFGFTTYVLVQNPQSTPTDVTITYQAAAGTVAGPSFNMPPNSRKTINVNDTTVISGADPSFSTRVHGSQPIIAERAMYWNGGPDNAQVCHDSIGLDRPYTNWYLADGQSSEGRETWTLVQNPNSTSVTVEVTYMTPDGSGNVVKTETISAGSRKSFNMADHSGISGRAAIMVVCKTAGSKVMVERAMYWNSRGTGTDTIGGYSD